jgi:hypothetical protein
MSYKDNNPTRKSLSSQPQLNLIITQRIHLQKTGR